MNFKRTDGDDAFSTWLNQEFSWRRIELSYYEGLVKDAKPASEQMIVRGAITLLYAHWEGFVKSAGVTYLEFILSRNKTYEELRPNFLALGMKGRLHGAESTLKGRLFVQACDLILNKKASRAHFLCAENVDTKSNLTFEVFENILWMLGLTVRKEYLMANKTIIEPLIPRDLTVSHSGE